MKRKILSAVAASAVVSGMVLMSGCGGSSSPVIANKTVRGNVSYIGALEGVTVTVKDANGNVLCQDDTNASGTYECTYNIGTPASAVASLKEGMIDEGVNPDLDDDNILLTSETITGSKTRATGNTVELDISIATDLGVEDTLANRVKAYYYTQAYMDILGMSEADAKAAAKTKIEQEATAGSIKNNRQQTQTDLCNALIAKINELCADLGDDENEKTASLLTIKTLYNAANLVLNDPTLTQSEKESVFQDVINSTGTIKSQINIALNSGTPTGVMVGQVAQNLVNAVKADNQPADNNDDLTDDATYTPVTAPTCNNNGGVQCGPQGETLKFFTEIDTPANGTTILVKSACFTGSNFSKVWENGKLKKVLMSRKYFRLSDELKNSTNTAAKFDAIRNYVDSKFRLTSCTSDLGLQTLNDGDRFVASMVLDFPTVDNCTACNNERPEYMVVMFEIDAKKNADGSVTLFSPAGSDIVGIIKTHNDTVPLIVAAQNAVQNTLTTDTDANLIDLDAMKYFNKVIDKIESEGNTAVTNAFKDVLVRNTTRACPFEIKLGMSQIYTSGTSITYHDIVQNPGTYSPSAYYMNQGNNNPYKGAYTSNIHAVLFKVCLN